MRRQSFRKRRLIIPGVFIAALLLAGEFYADMAPASTSGDMTSSSFASERISGEGADKTPAKANVVFYAGDSAVTKATIVPDPEGGYAGLPKVSKDGYDFVGWYTERAGGRRVSKAEPAQVKEGDTLYARWKKETTDVDRTVSGLPVLMYHWFYDTSAGDSRPTSLMNNWMEASQFEAEMAFLKDEGWYFPTWDEVYAYVRGETDLPDKSIVITIDDGRKSFYEYAVPVFEKYGVRGTGFIIAHKTTEKKVKRYSSEFVSLQSHTWDMHDGSGDKSLIQMLPFDQAVTDLTSAAAILGTTDALAYPYGYFDDTAVGVCRAAGIHMAFGTSGGEVYPGMDPLRLPRVRISSTQSAESFKQVYG
jgi:uncharacterized repeat protein (TIGR02543 family)